MRGVIGSHEVLAHWRIILSEFGALVLVRACWRMARGRGTFLECIF